MHALVLYICAAGAEGPGKLGYVRLATFNSNTTAAAQEAFYDLQKQGVAGLVLDIRNNGGGLFPAGEGLLDGVWLAHMLFGRLEAVSLCVAP
jgi:C-terminal processing protease CtpA/Prc